jgi:nucleoside-diphosphate-sugar epimerase
VASLRRFDRAFAQTNALRTAGLDHLLAASIASGARRLIAQSFTGWTNDRNGSALQSEADRLDPRPPSAQRQTLDAIEYLERTVLRCTDIEAVALRYGFLYGPGASEPMVDMVRKGKMPLVGDGAGTWSFLHVDDAAGAVVAAMGDNGRQPGDVTGNSVYNIVDDEPAPVSVWLPYLANAVGAKPPRSVPVWLARIGAGEVGVSLMTQIRGSSNKKAKSELCWQPRWSSWREGFSEGLDGHP